MKKLIAMLTLAVLSAQTGYCAGSAMEQLGGASGGKSGIYYDQVIIAQAVEDAAAAADEKVFGTKSENLDLMGKKARLQALFEAGGKYPARKLEDMNNGIYIDETGWGQIRVNKTVSQDNMGPLFITEPKYSYWIFNGLMVVSGGNLETDKDTNKISMTETRDGAERKIDVELRKIPGGDPYVYAKYTLTKETSATGRKTTSAGYFYLYK